jgi:hypothetical protein
LPEHLTEDLRAILLRRTPKNDEKLGIDARLCFSCVILNSFPKDLRTRWSRKPGRARVHHYRPWCEQWAHEGSDWVLIWTPEQLRRYYLYHLLLHEIGHLNKPWNYSGRKAESFAENFALDWARRLGELE